MNEDNKRNLVYFEATSMRDLYADMDAWQSQHRKRLLSVNVQRDGERFSCIALTNPTEVVIMDGSAYGGAKVGLVEGVHHLAARPQKKCFPGDARVLTAAGPRPISDVEPGDLVVSYRPDGTTTLRPVTRKLVHGESTICRVVLAADARPLRSTPEHRVLATRGWLQVKELREGDELIREEGCSRIVEILTEPNPEPVFNLYTAGEHTFFVEGIVVHNFAYLPVLRTWLHRLLLDPVTTGAERPFGAVLG